MRYLHSKSTLPACLGALLLIGLGSGCNGGAEPPSTIRSERSLCPSCGPRVGGESSDWTPTPCGSVARRAPIEADAAEALGYDLSQVRARAERDFDAPLHWEVHEVEEGEPAQGYERETRVRGSVTMSTAYEHHRPDPEYCDGTTCRREEVVVEQASCPHFLAAPVTVTLETLDGALSATAEGEVVQWAAGFEDMIDEDAADHLTAHAYADLSEVTGSLELFPPETAAWPESSDVEDAGLVTQPGHPYVGTLSVLLELEDDEVRGWLHPSISWQVVDETGATEGRNYEPLSALWGTPPAD